MEEIIKETILGLSIVRKPIVLTETPIQDLRQIKF
jgi:hypothetical protein